MDDFRKMLMYLDCYDSVFDIVFGFLAQNKHYVCLGKELAEVND